MWTGGTVAPTPTSGGAIPVPHASGSVSLVAAAYRRQTSGSTKNVLVGVHVASAAGSKLAAMRSSSTVLTPDRGGRQLGPGGQPPRGSVREAEDLLVVGQGQAPAAEYHPAVDDDGVHALGPADQRGVADRVGRGMRFGR